MIPRWRAATRSPSIDVDPLQPEPSLRRRGLHEQGGDVEGGRGRDAKLLWEEQAPLETFAAPCQLSVFIPGRYLLSL